MSNDLFVQYLQDLLELTPRKKAPKTKKDILVIIWDWYAKVWSQKIPRVTGKFGFGVQNEAGQSLTEFCKKTKQQQQKKTKKRTGHSKQSLTTTQENTLEKDITRWPIPKSDWLWEKYQ